MGEQKLNITWSEFADSCGRSFARLWGEEALADVVLATGDHHQITAHKVILSSCSEFFHEVLVTHPHQRPLLYLKDVAYRQLLLVLQFLYKGECQVDQDDVEEFLAVGKALRINGLNAKEQEQQEQDQDTIANTPSIQHIKEEVVQGDNDAGAECFKYTSETILGSSSGNNNERKRSCKSTLRKHKQIDYLELAGEGTEDSQDWLSCYFCGFMASSDDALRGHIATEHEGGSRMQHRVKQYQCDQCDYMASKLRMLKQHKVSAHEAESLFLCDKCDYQALSPHILKVHKTSKHDRVEYRCDMCDYTTNWAANLTTHRRKKHMEPLAISSEPIGDL